MNGVLLHRLFAPVEGSRKLRERLDRVRASVRVVFLDHPHAIPSTKFQVAPDLIAHDHPATGVERLVHDLKARVFIQFLTGDADLAWSCDAPNARIIRLIHLQRRSLQSQRP